MYQPYPQKKFESLNRNWWFQELAQHICLQAESPPFVTDLTLVAQLPQEVRAIYFLWEFSSEVGGNGIENYLLQQQGHHTPYAHKALKLVCASELLERLEAGIPHAVASESADFSTGADMAWFRQFPSNPKYPTSKSVDVDIYDLANDGIRDKCNAFIEAHRGIFVA